MGNLEKIIKLFQCDKCGGEFAYSNNAMICNQCRRSVSIIDGRIFQFQESKISSNTLEKTMYGPEPEELESEIKDKDPAFSLLTTLDVKFNKVVSLDYGCGSSRQVFDLSRNSEVVFGLDYDILPLKIASEVAKNNNYKNIYFVQHGQGGIPFKNNIFDVITTHQALEHVANLEQVIENISQKMKLGGILEADFPNGNSLGEILRELFHRIIKKANPHISKISLKRAKNTFAKNGFELVCFKPTQAINGPLIYFLEGFVFRFIFKKNKLWKIRKKIKRSPLFNFFVRIETPLMKISPQFAHEFKFVLKKIKA